MILQRVPVFTCFEILTVGIPFCIFKYLTAFYILNTYKNGSFVWASFSILFCLAVIDLIFNVFNLFSLILKQRRFLPICFLTFLSEKILINFGKSPENYVEFGSALDALLSFLLVTLMIVDGAISRLLPWEYILWSGAVVLNVLGAGLGRLWQAWGQLISGKPQAK